MVAGPFVVVARASLSVASPRGVAPGRPGGMPGQSPPPHAARGRQGLPRAVGATARVPGGAPAPRSPSGGGDGRRRRPDRSALPCIFRHLKRQAVGSTPTDSTCSGGCSGCAVRVVALGRPGRSTPHVGGAARGRAGACPGPSQGGHEVRSGGGRFALRLSPWAWPWPSGPPSRRVSSPSPGSHVVMKPQNGAVTDGVDSNGTRLRCNLHIRLNLRKVRILAAWGRLSRGCIRNPCFPGRLNCQRVLI